MDKIWEQRIEPNAPSLEILAEKLFIEKMKDGLLDTEIEIESAAADAINEAKVFMLTLIQHFKQK